MKRWLMGRGRNSYSCFQGWGTWRGGRVEKEEKEILDLGKISNAMVFSP